MSGEEVKGDRDLTLSRKMSGEDAKGDRDLTLSRKMSGEDAKGDRDLTLSRKMSGEDAKGDRDLTLSRKMSGEDIKGDRDLTLSRTMSQEEVKGDRDYFAEIQTAAIATGTGHDKIKDLYRKIANIYDQGLHHCRGPEVAAEELMCVLGDQRDVRIIDICAGTGSAGKQLQQIGFADIDAIDISKDMLAVAASKNVYRNIICQDFTSDECDIDEGTYDAVTIVGGFAPNHLTDTCFEKIIHICKPGAYIVIATSEKHFHEPALRTFDSRMQQLEADRQWTLLSRKILDSYITTYAEKTLGVVYVLQKAQGTEKNDSMP